MEGLCFTCGLCGRELTVLEIRGYLEFSGSNSHMMLVLHQACALKVAQAVDETSRLGAATLVKP